MAPIFRMADDIAQMHRRLAYAEGSELEGCLKLDLARMQWTLEGLIDDKEDQIDGMPWWTEWSVRFQR